MQILLVNDDGYKAKGLRVLCDAMARIGDVTVVAPKTPQSAMSSSVSLGLKKLAGKQLPELRPGRWFYLDATPVSCVKFALNFPFSERKPDVVISGINHGSRSRCSGFAAPNPVDGQRHRGCRVCGQIL